MNNYTQLLQQAKELLDKSYAPYSQFHVACLGVLNNNHIYGGVNIENVSYSAGVCAERSMICNIISNGDDPKDLTTIVIISDGEKICVPCGICRQTLAEFINDDVEIILANKHMEYQKVCLSDLFPYPFNPGSLDD